MVYGLLGSERMNIQFNLCDVDTAYVLMSAGRAFASAKIANVSPKSRARVRIYS